MNRPRYTFYICHQVTISGNFDDVCDLPGVGYFRIKDSPYNLLLANK